VAGAVPATVAGAVPATVAGALPATVAESYGELLELDRAGSVRWARQVVSPRAPATDPLDLAILALVASLRHVLTSQLHRHFNSGRAVTTTQRRLKRLSDAGLVERFQFHRKDGGGVPMCYVITAAGVELLQTDDEMRKRLGSDLVAAEARVAASRRDGDRRLREARKDVHVTGWALGLARVCSGATAKLRGPEASVLSPRLRSAGDGRAALVLADLRLPGGLTPHEFLRTEPTGERIVVESFETVRPDAIVELAAPPRAPVGGDGLQQGSTPDLGGPQSTRQAGAVDVIVELDDRLASGRAAEKLERYDHFLAGWSVHTQRYGHRLEAVPVVVFVCRDRIRARECARRADDVLRACRAYAGEYPFEWEYPGRERVLFASERDIHEALPCAYGVPRLPPDVRVLAANGDPRARETAVESREIPQRPHTIA
jgi:hypothetical protein